MKHSFTRHFVKKYHSLPPEIQKKFDKQLGFLIKDIRHPSLRAKKHDEQRGVWQARVDSDYRFYFIIKKDTYFLLDIRLHP